MATNETNKAGKDIPPHNAARHPGELDDSVTQAVESGDPQLQGPRGEARADDVKKDRKDQRGVAQQHLESGRHDATP